jgi:hypothetical protein
MKPIDGLARVVSIDRVLETVFHNLRLDRYILLSPRELAHVSVDYYSLQIFFHRLYIVGVSRLNELVNGRVMQTT